MTDAYIGRAQTRAKHFILKRYLQALTYKLFQSPYRELTYVDGFSGPWKSKTKDFSDTSFMIAIEVLKNAHFQFSTKENPRVTKCFFVEDNPKAYIELKKAVSAFHHPSRGFHVETFPGKFEDAVPQVMNFVGNSFALVFIDPTGWKGYPYTKISPILSHTPGEVLINFMYDYVNRAAGMADPKTVASLDPILGGPGWKDRLDPALATGKAVEKLFRQELQKVGSFKYVLSTCIEKETSDRPYFFIAYGTRSPHGLRAFRDVEMSALKEHETHRDEAKLHIREEKTGQKNMFTAAELLNDQTINYIVQQNKKAAKARLLVLMPIIFSDLVNTLLQEFMLRETDIKSICVELAKDGAIKAPWALQTPKKRTPQPSNLIEPMH
jgi:three-Cys-motif partner protein